MVKTKTTKNPPHKTKQKTTKKQKTYFFSNISLSYYAGNICSRCVFSVQTSLEIVLSHSSVNYRSIIFQMVESLGTLSSPSAYLIFFFQMLTRKWCGALLCLSVFMVPQSNLPLFFFLVSFVSLTLRLFFSALSNLQFLKFSCVKMTYSWREPPMSSCGTDTSLLGIQ